MCVPMLGMTAGTVAMLAASTAATVASTTVSAVGQSKQAKYQSAIMKRNAKLAEQQAADALKRGKEEESRHRMAVLRLAGQQVAQLSASGVQIGSGTPASLLEDTYYMAELDAEVIRSNAEREAWGYRAQAGGYEGQAGLFRQAGRYGVGESLLTGATTAADQWYRYTRAS